ncbi:MAG: hypothetical protein UY84_C0001G0069 [Candidatus Adlerbacteria bacterium GW2011_GWA2_54_12]|nr:MAG: hypothetical protein UY84_C0001G0069 [Candidatus Adlerbacteria bacterium GW2011_GWA2_54_12]
MVTVNSVALAVTEMPIMTSSAYDAVNPLAITSILMMKKDRASGRRFPGFPHEWDEEYGFTQYPNMLTEFWADLSGSGQKVLDFIIRQTIGWEKDEDTIALSQFRNGIRGKWNSVYITVERNQNRPSTFRLVFDDELKEGEIEETKGEGEEEQRLF